MLLNDVVFTDATAAAAAAAAAAVHADVVKIIKESSR